MRNVRFCDVENAYTIVTSGLALRGQREMRDNGWKIRRFIVCNTATSYTSLHVSCDAFFVVSVISF